MTLGNNSNNSYLNETEYLKFNTAWGRRIKNRFSAIGGVQIVQSESGLTSPERSVWQAVVTESCLRFTGAAFTRPLCKSLLAISSSCCWDKLYTNTTRHNNRTAMNTKQLTYSITVRDQMVPPRVEWWCETDGQPGDHTFWVLSKHGISLSSATLHWCQIKQMPRRS